MKFYVYILYSQKLDRFYTGNTELEPLKRLEQHNNSFNEKSFTTRGIPWELFFIIECISRNQARNIELHIKKMKSKRYIKNLTNYPELPEKLKLRFK